MALSGCGGPGQGFGQLAGGGIGALMGSQIGKGRGRLVATAIGAVLGASAGGAIGSTFDKRDESAAADAAGDAFETGRAVQWRNPQTGHYGEFRPQRVYRDDRGQKYCKFSHLAYIDGRPVTVHGKAYQTNDGSWHVASH